MTLHQILKGVYSLDGFHPENRWRPVVAVHPYYFHRHGKGVVMEGYEERLEKIVSSYEGPLITFDEKRYLDETAAIFASFGRCRDRYFIKTDNFDHHPRGITIARFIQFLAQFSGKPVGLIGGNLWIYQGKYDGCLGWYAERLWKKRLDFEFIDHLVFS